MNRNQPLRHEQASGARRAAFTLTELLIVITVMILVMAVAVPNVRYIVQQGREKSAISVMRVAAATSRSYAGQNPPFSQGSYQGCAIIVTPANEVRIARHTESASNGGTKLVLEADPRAGYADTADQYIRVSDGVGIVGIARNATGATPLLLAPPFAIRYNRYGQQIVRQGSSTTTPYDEVVYNGNYDANYATTERASNYNPSTFDPQSPNFLPANKTAAGYVLPFEELESVVGVIAYSKYELWEASQSFATTYRGPTLCLLAAVAGGGINAEARDWILANGTPIFFNRFSGDAIER